MNVDSIRGGRGAMSECHSRERDERRDGEPIKNSFVQCISHANLLYSLKINPKTKKTSNACAQVGIKITHTKHQNLSP